MSFRPAAVLAVLSASALSTPAFAQSESIAAAAVAPIEIAMLQQRFYAREVLKPRPVQPPFQPRWSLEASSWANFGSCFNGSQTQTRQAVCVTDAEGGFNTTGEGCTAARPAPQTQQIACGSVCGNMTSNMTAAPAAGSATYSIGYAFGIMPDELIAHARSMCAGHSPTGANAGWKVVGCVLSPSDQVQVVVTSDGSPVGARGSSGYSYGSCTPR